MYAFDFGVTAFYNEDNAEGTRELLSVTYTKTVVKNFMNPQIFMWIIPLITVLL